MQTKPFGENKAAVLTADAASWTIADQWLFQTARNFLSATAAWRR